jgi:hypothetical protein
MTYTLNGSTETLLDAKVDLPDQRIVPPLEEQLPTESLRLWGPTTEALKEGDYAKASQLKTEIEEAQRAIRRKRKETGETWDPVFFEFIPVSSEEDELGATERDPQGLKDSDHHQKGHWVFRAE